MARLLRRSQHLRTKIGDAKNQPWRLADNQLELPRRGASADRRGKPADAWADLFRLSWQELWQRPSTAGEQMDQIS